MDGKQLRDELVALVARYDAAGGPAVTSLPSGSNVTLALEDEDGGTVQLEANGVYEGTATFRIAGTTLLGAPGAKLIGSAGPAVYVPPGVHDIMVKDIDATAPGYSEAVCRLGDNGSTQTTLAQEPYAILLANVRVPTHRGKRAFEVNARGVTLVDCRCEDVWFAGVDSQGICVINSSGGITVLGGEYQAGSSGFMTGGDTVKMLGADGLPVTPTDITLDGVRLTRPLSWRTDGVNRGVKNCFEVKNGRRTTFKNGYMGGNWLAAQTGEAIMLTPTRGGISVDTIIEDSIIEDVPSCLVLVGRHVQVYTSEASSAIFRRNRVRIDKALGGTGAFAKVGAEPAALVIEDCLVQSVGLSGDNLLDYYRGSVRRADGTTTPGGTLGRFSCTNTRMVSGKYAFRLDGQQGGGATGLGLPMLGPSPVVTGNVFGGDTINGYQKQNFPSNTYLSRAAFDAAHPWITT